MIGTNHPEAHRHRREWIGRLAKDLPGPIGAFAQLHRQATAVGALSAKVKGLSRGTPSAWPTRHYGKRS